MVEKEVKEQERSVNYAMLSLFQYVASILVILVHCQRLFPNEILHFTQKSMFGLDEWLCLFFSYHLPLCLNLV